MRRLTCTLLAGYALAPLAASAPQVPHALLLSGAPIPGVPGATFAGSDWIASNHSGGVVISLNSSGAGNHQYLWGSPGGGSLGILRTDGPAGAVTVTGFTGGCGGAGTSQLYVAQLAGLSESLMLDDTVVASVGDQTAPGGWSWVRFEEPFLDSGGNPWFRGLYSGPANNRWGLFRGTSMTPIVEPDDVIPGLPGNVHPGGGPNAGYDVSGDGSHWIGAVTAANSRVGIVKDGQVLSAGGVPLVTGNVLPAAFQLSANESYSTFGEVQVCELDRWAVRAGTPSNLILRDDELFARIGDVVDGWILVHPFRSIALNRYGGLAWIARVQGAGGTQHFAVFREDDLLFKEGDPVDVDGDGLPDPGYSIFEVPGGLGRLGYTDDGVVWAEVKIAQPQGGTPWAVVAVGDPSGVPFCTSVPNSTGLPARILSIGSNVIADNALRLRCVDMPTQQFGYFLTSRNQGLVIGPGGSQGDLCLGSGVGRFNSQVSSSGSIGALELLVDLTALPQPSGTVPAVIGESWSFQCWFRDANPMVTSNFSDGVEVSLQ